MPVHIQVANDQATLEGDRRITGRHAEVLQLMAEGVNTRDSARRLGVAEQTIKNHRHEIYRRLEARNCSHAVAIAIAAGYVHIDAGSSSP
jgi:DNA-binding CsgD family transcriptional regulator